MIDTPAVIAAAGFLFVMGWCVTIYAFDNGGSYSDHVVAFLECGDLSPEDALEVFRLFSNGWDQHLAYVVAKVEHMMTNSQAAGDFAHMHDFIAENAYKLGAWNDDDDTPSFIAKFRAMSDTARVFCMQSTKVAKEIADRGGK